MVGFVAVAVICLFFPVGSPTEASRLFLPLSCAKPVSAFKGDAGLTATAFVAGCGAGGASAFSASLLLSIVAKISDTTAAGAALDGWVKRKQGTNGIEIRAMHKEDCPTRMTDLAVSTTTMLRLTGEELTPV